MAEYIEREAAIDFIQENQCKKCSDIGLCGGCAVLTAIKLFQTVPAADVAPVRHGRWIETTQPLGWRDETCAECSECGEDFVLDELCMDDMKNLMLYCPNCGAKMDGGET